VGAPNHRAGFDRADPIFRGDVSNNDLSLSERPCTLLPVYEAGLLAGSLAIALVVASLGKMNTLAPKDCI
jgi:hypothetical protein